MSGVDICFVGEICVIINKICGNCLIKTLGISKAETDKAQTQRRAHLDTKPKSRH